jgi:hypothetical protein
MEYLFFVSIGPCRQSSLSKEAERDNGKVRVPKRRGCCYRSIANSFVIGVVGAFVPFRSPADLGDMGEKVIDEGGMIRWPSDEIHCFAECEGLNDKCLENARKCR